MAEPKCRYYKKCGGCSAQHIDYEVQLQNKVDKLKHIIKQEVTHVESAKPYGYRNRMDFIFQRHGIGFREKGHWNRLIDIKECPISNQRINDLLIELRAHFIPCNYFDIHKQKGAFRYGVIRTGTNDSSISFLLNSESTKLKDAIEKIQEFAKVTTATNIVVAYQEPQTDVSISDDFFVVKGEDHLTANYLDKTFQYSTQGFFQNNHEMAQKMHTYVQKILEKYETKNAMLLDLYGGVGTFGIINAHLFKEVLTVEAVEQCIVQAKNNATINNLTNYEALVLDAKQSEKLKQVKDKPLFVITDPPRSGMHPKTIKFLNQLSPELIIYVSCNPTQLVRELPHFEDYEIKSSALFDLFPQTPHSEAVLELKKK